MIAIVQDFIAMVLIVALLGAGGILFLDGIMGTMREIEAMANERGEISCAVEQYIEMKGGNHEVTESHPEQF